MLEPAAGQTAIAAFVTRQFLEDFHLRAGMAEHVHEIVHDNGEVEIQQIVRPFRQLLCILM